MDIIVERDMAQVPEVKQWRDGRWYFNYRTGSASPLWKSRDYAERQAREYAGITND